MEEGVSPDLRDLQTKLLEVGLNRPNFGAAVNNLDDPDEFSVTYMVMIPQEQVSYGTFFEALNGVISCKTLSLNHISDFVETLEERSST